MKFTSLILHYLVNNLLIVLVKTLVIKSKANHIKGYTSLTDSTFLTIPFCIGKPKQCLDLLYSNKKSLIIICNSTLSNKVKQTFDITKSETFEFIKEKTFSLKSQGLKLDGKQMKDYIEFNSNQYDNRKLPMLLVIEINFNMVYFDGILGMYKQNIIGSKFSFLNYLFENDIISNLNFGHNFKTKTQVDFYIGETPSDIDKYSFCESKNEAFWYCKLNSISFYSNNTLYRNYSTEDKLIQLLLQFKLLHRMDMICLIYI